MKKSGRVHTMFGAGTSECAGDTEIIGAGRNRGRRFEGMSDSAVEATERLPACDYSGKKVIWKICQNIKVSAIAKELGEEEAAVRDAFSRIRTLNPKPGRIYGRNTGGYVIPDIIVSKEHGKYIAELNEAVYRELRLNEFYVKAARFERGGGSGIYYAKAGAGRMAESMHRAEKSYIAEDCRYTG